MASPDPVLSAKTLVTLLRARAAQAPERRAYTFLEDGERATQTLTFGELDHRARAIARALVERGLGGERALLLYPSGLDFVAAFCASLYAGVVAIPAPASDPAQLQRTLPRLCAIARDARAKAVLTTRANRPVLEELCRHAPELRDLAVLATDELAQVEPCDWEPAPADPDGLAFLQYTSGSTADPKGVMISHGNLLYTAADIDAGWKYSPESVVVSWLPIFHDMGLICGIVLPLYSGCACVLMSPAAFVQRPLRWLRALSDYGGTHSAAPNFAYDLCVRKITPEERRTLDLSKWEVTLSSAEPVRYASMRRFTEAFAAQGFRWEVWCPGFGLAEATVKVVASRKGEEPAIAWVDGDALEEGRVVWREEPADPLAGGRGAPRAIVGCGRDDLETRTLVVDPESCRPAAPDTVGEIWVRGPCVAQGYLGREDATRETFGGTLAEVPAGEAAGPWMRTGDLGFVDANGEVYFTGRRKDLLVLRGRNVYPQDVELLVEGAHPAVRAGCTAAFALELDGEDQLAMTVEVDPRRMGEAEEVVEALRACLFEQLELDLRVLLLVPPRAVPKTSSGKIQRRAAEARVRALAFEPAWVAVGGWTAGAVAPGALFESLEGLDPERRRALFGLHLATLAAAELDRDPTAAADEALEGLDLAGARRFARHLAHDLGLTLEPGAFFPRPSLEALEASLEEAFQARLAQAQARAAEAAADELGPLGGSSRATVAGGSQPRDEAGLRAWLVATLAASLELDPGEVDVNKAFAQFGMDSLQAVDLAASLEQLLERALPATLVWDHPTIARLAEHLASEEREREPAPAGRPAQAAGAATARATEAIALVGVGCRFPGAHGPEAYWKLLADGVDAIGEVPRDRFDVDAFYDPAPGTEGKLSTRWGGFLERVDTFDAPFFGISAREADRMDPQQRLALEVAWEALENGGFSAERLRGSRGGVFLGVGSADYVRLLLSDVRAVDAYAGTGNAYSIAANRLSYVLDWRGPSVAVDTACSSSLVALHLARQSLLAGECDLALAGGVNLILTPEWTVAFSHAEMMAADGRCKTFDAAADGYVRGEGCGLVVLKRLSDAERDGDRILALVHGSAINQDGRSNGITAPNGTSQQAVLRAALESARVAPAELDYVEAHGTGTPLGDPIEVEALGAVFGPDRPAGKRLGIGSVKTNIGHLEAAAGVASVIKVALALDREWLPGQLHFQALNPHIDLERHPIEVLDRARPWARGQGTRLAGVSSFGFGGTNAHVVLGEAPRPRAGTPAATPAVPRPRYLVPLSATDEERLVEVARGLERHLADHPQLDLGDVANTLAVGRSHLAERLALSAESTLELRTALEAFAADPKASAPGRKRGRRVGSEGPRVAWLFTGQGAQYPDMGRGLYEGHPVFRGELERCAAVLDPLLERPLLELLYGGGDDAALQRTANTQPALFALEWSLAALWRSFGLEPDLVLGHSLGEYVAACVAGVFGLEDGLRLVAERARLMQSLPPDGAMATVLAPRKEVEERCARLEGQLGVAAVNGPANTVVSGERAALEAFTEGAQGDGLRVVPLRVSHAFHSPLMQPVVADFEALLDEQEFRSPRIPLASNLYGRLFAPEEVPDAAYWREHLLRPVLFGPGLEALQAGGAGAFLELGPHPGLSELGKRILEVPSEVWHTSLRRGMDDWRTLWDAVGGLYALGKEIDWASLERPFGQRRLALPGYPFQRRRHWIANLWERGRTPSTSMPAMNPSPESPGADFPPAGAGEALSTDAFGQVVRLFREQTAVLLSLGGSLPPEAQRALGRLLEERGEALASLGAGSGAPARSPVSPGGGPARQRPGGPGGPGGAGGAGGAGGDVGELTPINGAVTEDAVQEGVLGLVARITGYSPGELRLDHHLNGDLGFDSLMTVELDRRLRKLFPGLEDGEQLFTEDITLGELCDLLTGNLGCQKEASSFLTDNQRVKKTFATYAELIGKDPEQTYVGGAFRDETHVLHHLHAEGRTISGQMDVENKYAGSSGFHLTQMGAYSFIVQLIQGYLCYKYGVKKDDLGMPTLSEIDMRWKGMVRRSKDIRGKVEERHVTEKDGIYTLEFTFEIEEGACSGRIIGVIPIRPNPKALEESEESLTIFQREAQDYETYGELLQKDPRATYTGGMFKDEVHRIHDVECEGRVIRARMDVTNEYAGTPRFHLTQMGSYSYTVQLMLGYLCYKYGIQKDDLGMPTLREYSIRWREMIGKADDIHARVEERSFTVENGRYRFEFGFELGEGNGSGYLIGLIPIVGES